LSYCPSRQVGMPRQTFFVVSVEV